MIYFSASSGALMSAGLPSTGLKKSLLEVKTLKLDDKDIVPGLRRGLAGVKEGQECFILFSGKYGFGKHELGTIPANAALVYHIKVESISN